MELFIFARFHAREGEAEAVAAALRDVVGATAVEPGCVSIGAFRSTYDPRLFYIHSRWVDEAAFGLDAGQVSDLLEIPRGFAIVKVEEKQPSGTQPLAEVRDQIARALREAGAEQAARDWVDADLEKARTGTSLEDLATGRGLKATTSSSVSRGEPLPGVTSPTLLATAIGLDEGAVEEIVAVEPPYYLFKVTAKTPSDIKPLAEAHDQIVATLRAQKARTAARAAADELLAAAKDAPGGAATLVSAAQAKGWTADDTGPFNRTQAPPTRLRYRGRRVAPGRFAFAPQPAKRGSGTPRIPRPVMRKRLPARNCGFASLVNRPCTAGCFTRAIEVT